MKKILSLALALAVCLSLAIPALAAEPHSFENSQIQITNVVEEKLEDEYEGEFVCVAPAHFALGNVFVEAQKAAEQNGEYYEAGFVFFKVADGADVNAGNYMQYPIYGADDEPIQTDTLTEAGAYILDITEHSDSGGGFTRYLVTVLPGDGSPAPAPKPDIDGPDVIFNDVNASDWFAPAVQWAVEQEITTGTTATTFSPYNTCTEAQILTFLWRAKGSPEPKEAAASTDYYAKAAQWAKEQGITDEFEAAAPCTRAMTVEYLWKAAGKPQSTAKPAFTDIEGDGDLAQAVAWAVETGVTTGTSDTTFTPAQICNRAQIVTFLYRNLAK